MMESELRSLYRCIVCGSEKTRLHFRQHKAWTDCRDRWCVDCRQRVNKVKHLEKSTRLGLVCWFEKRCRTCGETKELSKFRKDARRFDGRDSRCGSCKGKLFYQKNADRLKEKERKRRALKREDPTYRAGQVSKVLEWRKKNKAKERAQRERYRRRKGMMPAKHEMHVHVWSRWKRANEAKKARLHDAHVKRWKTDNTLQFRWRYNFDPEFNLKQRLRARARKYDLDAFAYKYAAQLIKKVSSSEAFYKLVGYTVADLRVHLERQFTRGMTWKRFTAGEIHIDHIIPRSAFDLSDIEQVRRCWCLSNLRPLWRKHNQTKSARIECLL